MLKLQSQRPGHDVHFLHQERLDRTGGVREDRYTAKLGDGLVEQLQQFAGELRADAEGRPCNIPAWAREARNEPEPNRIGTTGDHDDGDGLGGVLGCRHSLRPPATMMSTLSRTSSTARSGS